MSDKGYIYVRNHSSYYDTCKMGKTSCIPERDSQYSTGEITRGYFEIVFEIHIKKLSIIERLLQYEFRALNIRYDAGTEFYDKTVINLIEPYLNKIGVNYKRLNKQEISDLVRCNRVRQTMKKISIQSWLNALIMSAIELKDLEKPNELEIKDDEKKPERHYNPRNYQTDIIEKSVEYFQQHDKGMLVLICGVGKTLISLWITQYLKSNTVLIGVPNKSLLYQWKEVVNLLFHNIPCLIISTGVVSKTVKEFLSNNRNNSIIITTYASSYKIFKSAREIDFIFDMKILDEAHHLTTSNMKLSDTDKKYIHILNVPSTKQLSLTATIKQIEGGCDVISNDNVEYFGEIIDKKGLLWAINENIICDYVIQTIVTDHEQLDLLETQITSNKTKINKVLFLSAFSALKSIIDGHSHHLLIYSNNRNNSAKIVEYIKMLLETYFDIPVYYSSYHSETNANEQKNIMNNFINAKYGIITCVYCLSEGWNCPLLDGVVFAENMTSNIRIVQSALRSIRKNKDEPNKMAKIIIPILNSDWLDYEKSDFKKVREIIYQMGLEDETITQKIKVYKINIPARIQYKSDINKINKNPDKEYNDKLTQELTEELRLKTISRSIFGMTYEKARKIIAGLNINSKSSYYELCEKNSLPRDPEISFKGQFSNWIEYLSIERNYYDLDTCKIKVCEYLNTVSDIRKYYLDLAVVIDKLCKIDNLFPPQGLWVDYYNVKDLRDIIPNKKKRVGIK